MKFFDHWITEHILLHTCRVDSTESCQNKELRLNFYNEILPDSLYMHECKSTIHELAIYWDGYLWSNDSPQHWVVWKEKVDRVINNIKILMIPNWHWVSKSADAPDCFKTLKSSSTSSTV